MKINEIKIGERLRKEMGNIQELADSIKKQGLLQSIGINEDNQLIFGVRRIEAVKLLGWENIDARVVNVTSLVEGEITENEIRKNFTNDEKIAIGKMIEQQLGERRGKYAREKEKTIVGQMSHYDKENQSANIGTLKNNNELVPMLVQVESKSANIGTFKTRDIAAQKAGFGSHGTYEKAKLISEKANAEIKIKLDSGEFSINQAYAEIKKDERKQKIEQIKNNAVNYQNTNQIELLEGDLFDVINQVPDKSIDLLLTDPPYLVMNDYEWDKKEINFLDTWIKKIQSKLKDKYIGFIFCDSRLQYEFETILRKYFKIKNRLIWIRKNMSMGRCIKEKFISSYEVVFYFGTKELNLSIEWSDERFDSFEYAVPQSNFKEGKYHPTQKPLELFKRLIKLGSTEGELILDPFAGSGTTGLCCKELNRKCILIEKEQEYIDIIKGRLSEQF